MKAADQPTDTMSTNGRSWARRKESWKQPLPDTEKRTTEQEKDTRSEEPPAQSECHNSGPQKHTQWGFCLQVDLQSRLGRVTVVGKRNTLDYRAEATPAVESS